MDFLLGFPELAAIGREQLQANCNEWVKRPIARSFGVVQVFVGAGLQLSVHIDKDTPAGAVVLIQLDELLGYIVDHHFSDPR